MLRMSRGLAQGKWVLDVTAGKRARLGTGAGLPVTGNTRAAKL